MNNTILLTAGLTTVSVGFFILTRIAFYQNVYEYALKLSLSHEEATLERVIEKIGRATLCRFIGLLLVLWCGGFWLLTNEHFFLFVVAIGLICFIWGHMFVHTTKTRHGIIGWKPRLAMTFENLINMRWN